MSSKNKLFLAMTATLMSLTAGCADLLTFDLNAQVTEFVVFGDPTLHSQHISLDSTEVPAISMPMTNMAQGSVHLNSLLFYVTETGLSSSTDQDGLEFMTAMDVYAIPNNPHSGLPTIKLASWNGPAPAGTMVMDMEVDSKVDLNDYIAAGFSLKIGPAGVVPMDDVTMRGEMTFSVSPL